MNILSITKPRAKKIHICDFCNQPIFIAEVYNNEAIADSGTVYNFKTHIDCALLANKLYMFDQVDGCDTDSFGEYIREEFLQLNEEHNTFTDDETDDCTFKEQLEYVKYHHIQKLII